MMVIFAWESAVKEAANPEYQFVVYKRAMDDVEDVIWNFEKTEDEAKEAVKSETENYSNSPEFQFYYTRNPFLGK